MILSVDPGRDKTGCAVVEEDGSLVVKKVIPTKNYEKEIAKLLSSFTPRALIMGNGTRHREMKERSEKLLQAMDRDIPVILVDENIPPKWESSGIEKTIPPKAWLVSFPRACAPFPCRWMTMWPGLLGISTWVM